MWLQRGLIFAICVIGLQGKDFRCPLGFYIYGSSCYLFSHDTATYPEANSFCEFLSSHVATITTKEEDDFLRGHLLRNGNGQHYYIGGTDMRLEGTWTWEKPFRKIGFKDWNPGQPNGGGTQQCLELHPGSFQYRWNDIQCTEKYRFICEKMAKLCDVSINSKTNRVN